MTRIEQIKALCDAATKGPWNCQDKTGKWLSDKTDWTADLNRRAEGGCSSSVPIQKGISKKTLALVVWEGWNDKEAETNAQLIAQSRTLVPELLELVEEMAAALEEYADGHYCRALAKYKAWNEGE